MSTKVIRYRTKPDRADENQKLVEDVFAERCEEQPVAIDATVVGSYGYT